MNKGGTLKTISKFAMTGLVGITLGLGSVTASMAQDKAGAGAPTTKVLLDNAKVRVTETTWKPGQENTPNSSIYRVGRALTNGTMQKTFADGKKEVVNRKAGDVYFLEPSAAYTNKNIGMTPFTTFNVQMK